MVYFTWTKGTNQRLSTHFLTDEFDCHCIHSNCKDQKISVDLIERLELVRQAVGPITVTSGYRCARYQARLLSLPEVETVKNSKHCTGDAADIQTNDIQALYKTVARYFTAIGVAKTFIHVDTRPGKHSWTYK